MIKQCVERRLIFAHMQLNSLSFSVIQIIPPESHEWNDIDKIKIRGDISWTAGRLEIENETTGEQWQHVKAEDAENDADSEIM